MQVKDVMTKNVVIVKRSTTLSELMTFFQKHNFHTIPVINNDGSLAGIVKLENVLNVFQPYGTETKELLKPVPFLLLDDDVEEDIVLSEISSEMGKLLLVDDMMDTDFVSVKPEESVQNARALMRMQKIEQLPVVEGDKLVGLISLFDIVFRVFKEKGII